MGISAKLKDASQKRLLDEILTLAAGGGNKQTILRAFDLAAYFTPRRQRPKLAFVRDKIQRDHPAYALAQRVVGDFSPAARDRFIQCFVINCLLRGSQVRDDFSAAHGFAPPFTVLISPTMRCNLACTGCYAAEYPAGRDMSRQTLQRIVDQGREMGTYWFTLLGGEPFIYPGLLDFCAANRDCYFLIFSNGTLIDDQAIHELAHIGNVAPMLSIEGDREATDQRRGEGAFEQQMTVMSGLRTAGVPFGYSITVTRGNWRTVVGDAFVDGLVDKGAVVGWHFLYMPVGRGADTSPMLRPGERNAFRRGIERIRAAKPIFPVDFWGDAPYIGGCIAAKHYVHITSEGWVEPCIFTHFATDNINEVSLLEAFDSPYFNEIRRRQPFNENLLMPCMLIDNPHHSREIMAVSGARPTHPGADGYFGEMAGELDEYAAEVERVYAPIWSASHPSGSKLVAAADGTRGHFAAGP